MDQPFGGSQDTSVSGGSIWRFEALERYRLLNNLAEIKIILHQIQTTIRCTAEVSCCFAMVNPVLWLVVWALKREVRAIRGCLGMHTGDEGRGTLR